MGLHGFIRHFWSCRVSSNWSQVEILQNSDHDEELKQPNESYHSCSSITLEQSDLPIF
jgi:hypothetical protein